VPTQLLLLLHFFLVKRIILTSYLKSLSNVQSVVEMTGTVCIICFYYVGIRVDFTKYM
jgi:hypothetical protein